MPQTATPQPTVVRASREDDYRIAWVFFEAQAPGQTTANNSTQG